MTTELLAIGIGFAAANSALAIMNMVDSRSDRIHLWIYKSIYGASVLYGSLGPGSTRKTYLKYWIGYVKLSLQYKKKYPNGTNSEYYIELPEEILYIIRYTPELLEHFFEQKTSLTGIKYYVTKRTSITLPTEEFSIQSIVSEKTEQPVELLVKCYVSDGKPVTIRCITSPPCRSKNEESRELQKLTLTSLIDSNGLDNLIGDIEYSSPNNTRFNIYLTQMIAYKTIEEIGNPNPTTDPPKKVIDIIKELTEK